MKHIVVNIIYKWHASTTQWLELTESFPNQYVKQTTQHPSVLQYLLSQTETVHVWSFEESIFQFLVLQNLHTV